MDFDRIDDMLDDVMPSVPGCTEFTAIDKLREAAIEFCRKTLYSQETIEDVDLDANEPVITLDTSSNQTLITRIMMVWNKDLERFLDEYNRLQMKNRQIGWRTSAAGATSYPSAYVRESQTEIRIFPVPTVSTAGVLDITIAVIPAKACTRLDRRLFEEHREAIVSGALARLLRQSNTDWYDPNGARDYEATFYEAISQAKAAVNKDFVREDTRVQMRPMA